MDPNTSIKVGLQQHGTVDKRLFRAFEKELHTDVVFVVGNENQVRIKAHKLVVRLSSDIFEALISAHETNGVSEITLPGVDPGVFRRLLKFVYTDELELYELDALFALAEMLGFNKLDQQTVTALINLQITFDNLIPVLELCQKVPNETLTQKCISFVLENVEQALVSKSFLLIPHEILCRLLLDDRLRQCFEVVEQEILIFLAVQRWAVFQCRKNNLEETPENLQMLLGEAKRHIRYTYMNQEQFTVLVEPSGILLDCEVKYLNEYFKSTSVAKRHKDDDLDISPAIDESEPTNFSDISSECEQDQSNGISPIVSDEEDFVDGSIKKENFPSRNEIVSTAKTFSGTVVRIVKPAPPSPSNQRQKDPVWVAAQKLEDSKNKWYNWHSRTLKKSKRLTTQKKRLDLLPSFSGK